MTGPHAGLHPERTVLAWLRTSLAAAGLAAVSIKAGVEHRDVAALVSGGLASVATVVLYGFGHLRAARSRRVPETAAAMRLVSVLVLAAATAATIAVLDSVFAG